MKRRDLDSSVRGRSFSKIPRKITIKAEIKPMDKAYEENGEVVKK